MDRETQPTKEGLEQLANFEGNHTELMIGRLSSPKIFEQIVKHWEDRLKVDWKKPSGGTISNLGAEETKWGKNRKLFFAPQNRAEIEEELQRRLDEVMVSTTIKIGKDKNASTECIPTELILDGVPADSRQMSIIEAHEKGHLIRTYSGMYYEFLFHDGFDFSPHIIENEVRRRIKKKGLPANLVESRVASMYQYISEPSELCERMAQLKNYFGMSGNEEFTKAHLDYAREHYILDTKMDNNMTLFFECITPDTEEEFIRLMNTAGI